MNRRSLLKMCGAVGLLGALGIKGKEKIKTVKKEAHSRLLCISRDDAGKVTCSGFDHPLGVDSTVVTIDSAGHIIKSSNKQFFLKDNNLYFKG